jgi:LysM repeat protein
MMFRVPFFHSMAALAATAMFASSAHAEDGVQAELKALRQLVELQSKQIEVLSAQVARLNAQLEQRADSTTASAGTATAAHPQPGETTEFAIPAARPVPPAAAGNVHVIVKGDSLDKIAKTHGTTVQDLQRLNHISDPKKLQIGQQLILPPSTPKKEGQ